MIDTTVRIDGVTLILVQQAVTWRRGKERMAGVEGFEPSANGFGVRRGLYLEVLRRVPLSNQPKVIAPNKTSGTSTTHR